ncbi:MAG TPA: metallophosphoesterase [Acidimicrobiia bacterium]|nr:metallophosphoesterase [Acidimicrobiia bacterium]
MLVVSDIHGAFDALTSVAARSETLLILGDLANLTDYRTGEGAVAKALGLEFARDAARARGEGDFERMRTIWQTRSGDPDAARKGIEDAVNAQYEMLSTALKDFRGYVIHGNVDRPDSLIDALPAGFDYVHGKTVEIEGVTFGFAGGGVTTPLKAAGEVSDVEMTATLDSLGEVDVLCTHVAPALGPLETDVITGRRERSSRPILDYIQKSQPRMHLFGDVHQPQASRWRIGRTQCVNVGYFRATGRAFRLDVTDLRAANLRLET